jgi:hypothetical protein
MEEVRGFVHEVDLVLGPDADERAPGGAVTSALCGHWEHAGRCRWPHNSEITRAESRARFRVVFVSTQGEEERVRATIETGLGRSGSWQVLESRRREPTPDEARLTAKLREP